jgi:hypothetical protein
MSTNREKSRDTSSDAIRLAGSAPASRPDVVRRKEAARILHVSETTLRRRYEGKTLPVDVDDAGVHIFSLADVEAIARELHITLAHDAHDAHDAAEPDAPAVHAELFELFEADTHPVDVVTKLRTVHPDVVEKAYAQWVRMRGGLVLEPDHVNTLRAVAVSSPALRGAMSFDNADSVVAGIKAALEAPPRRAVCLLCAKKAATLCATCLGREQNAAQRAQRDHERELKKLEVDAERARAGYAREDAERARAHEREVQRAHERHLAEVATRRGKA